MMIETDESEQMRRDVLLSLLEPPQTVIDAMMIERGKQHERNGHGLYGYRDLWRAGVAAALRLNGGDK